LRPRATRAGATKIFKTNKPITVSIPSGKLDYKGVKRGFMPNLIHSLDASNIHLLIDLIIKQDCKINLYTIHDCFASSCDGMEILDKLVREAFIAIYFDMDYLFKLHEYLIAKIGSYELIYKSKKNSSLFIIKDNKEITIPTIPSEFIESWNKNKHTFVDSIKKSTNMIG
jgi:DNA-directed RNA polymerase